MGKTLQVLKRIGRAGRIGGLAAAVLLGWPMGATAAQDPAGAPDMATGVVFADENGNGRHDADEQGVPGVRVSNGAEIVTTDTDGRYRLSVTDGDIIFVIKPRDWMTPVSDDQLPRFYYIHAPQGSPPSHFKGVDPTGPLPASIDFALMRQPEPEQFDVILFGDTQPHDLQQVEYIAHDVVEPLIGTDAAFGVTLGDVVFDDLGLYPTLIGVIGKIGIPWYNVPGNHDMNFDAPDDAGAMETFKRFYGPPYYAFDYGPVHFVVLDDVCWVNPDDQERGRYHAEIGERQLAFLRHDLAEVARDRLVVLLCHIPVGTLKDADAFWKVLSGHPHTVIFAAHEHIQRVAVFEQRQATADAPPRVQLVTGTVCGPWWAGVPDEVGIPHATMMDGTPNGHLVATFSGNKYRWRWRPARRPADYAMKIMMPEVVAADGKNGDEVVVNFFTGDSSCDVRCRVNDGEWRPLEHELRPDPAYAAMKALEANEDYKLPGGQLPRIANSTHIYVGQLPAGLPAGVHTLEVRATDRFGQEFTGRRIFRVE